MSAVAKRVFRALGWLSAVSALGLVTSAADARPKTKSHPRDKVAEHEEKSAKKRAGSKGEKAEPKTEPKAKPAEKGDETQHAAWVIEKPAAETQTQKSAEERGVNPCNTPDPGWGIYDKWSRAPSMGQMISPAKGGVTTDGGVRRDLSLSRARARAQRVGAR